ncbi:MAG: potassium-transporting ATPase subunit KdpA, partial [Leptolyngbyaceae cyanobacterium CAN_BIN12]|nr:potassium-transporting ATPase subunit KdpA [Leptolyngbyaceae cyanobacterium CAN_BIN12]
MLQGWIQIALTVALVVLITPFLGGYMARVFLAQKTWLDPVMTPVERMIFKLSGVQKEDMTGWQYARAVLYGNLAMAVMIFAIFMLQGVLPLNPTQLGAPTWDTALHTTISFVTNTNQQHYSGETTYSYFSQVAALGFMFFTSAATGLAVG